MLSEDDSEALIEIENFCIQNDISYDEFRKELKRALIMVEKLITYEIKKN
jgi:hypothetical protein